METVVKNKAGEELDFEASYKKWCDFWGDDPLVNHSPDYFIDNVFGNDTWTFDTEDRYMMACDFNITVKEANEDREQMKKYNYKSYYYEWPEGEPEEIHFVW